MLNDKGSGKGMPKIPFRKIAIRGENVTVVAVVCIVVVLIIIPLGITAVTSARNGPLFMPGIFDFSAFKVFLGKDTLSLIFDT